MAGYSPMKITGMTTGLVQSREEFILPNDAYPVLVNAFVWRERIKRKKGASLLGRLQRNLTAVNLAPHFTLLGPAALGIFTDLGITATQPNASIVPGNISPITLVFPAPVGQTLSDTTGTGTFTIIGAGVITSATINYSTGVVTYVASAGGVGPFTPVFTGSYYPTLPVMGILTEELAQYSVQQTIYFDTMFAYVFNFTTNLFSEWIPGTTWTGSDSDFFWSTNYWNTPPNSNPPGVANSRLFWVTNFSGPTGDPIRFTDGNAWVNFAPQIDNAMPNPNFLQQCLALVPFRGRLVAFNTWEGNTLGTSINYPQRIRWAAIGNPITANDPVLFPASVPSFINPNAWRDDIRGQGGFLNIPTTETIVSIGFVRDNLVIYCEHSTWQLRYTGRSIAPFQIEKVNSELGAQSTFSAVQFDTSLVGIGDKGVIQCDSYQSKRIDIKIPDLVFKFNNVASDYDRVYGIRDFQQQLAYWTYPYYPSPDQPPTYPNRRLVYNYENDSWAIFIDSFTVFGSINAEPGLTWQNANRTWEQANVPWNALAPLDPIIGAGNQQGFIQILDQQTVNDASLQIKNITGLSPSVTIVTSPNHNLETGQIIQINGILAADPFFTLNGGIFQISFVDANNFQLFKFNPIENVFNTPQVNGAGTYIGAGTITVLDNFVIQSKKFNYVDEGQAFQLGFIDILMDQTTSGAISIYIYTDYNTADPVNTYPQNTNDAIEQPDTFFNSIIPTSAPNPNASTKNWQRVYCQVRSAFVTIAYTLSPPQMNGLEQQSDVQIDAQILWTRKAGRNLPPGV